MKEKIIKRGTITKVNNEKKFIIVDSTYMIEMRLCMEGTCRQGCIVEMIKEGHRIVSFRVLSEEFLRREREAQEKERMRQRQEKTKIPWPNHGKTVPTIAHKREVQEKIKTPLMNYWESLPTIAYKREQEKKTDIGIEYVGKDCFNNEIEKRHINGKYAFYIFYEQEKYVVFYSDVNAIQTEVLEIQKFPNQKKLVKVKERHSAQVPYDNSVRYTGGRWKDYWCEVESTCGWRTVYETREVEKWIEDRSNMDFACFQSLLNRIKKKEAFLMLGGKPTEEEWVLQRFSGSSFLNRQTECSKFIKKQPFTIQIASFTDETVLFKETRSFADTFNGYPECISGVKLLVNGKSILVERTANISAKTFCQKYAVHNLSNVVGTWERINSFYRKVRVPEITIEHFLEVLEKKICMGQESLDFISEQKELLSGICYTDMIQIMEFVVEQGKNKEKLCVKYQKLLDAEGIEVGRCYNELRSYAGRRSKEYLKYTIVEEIETDTGKRIVKAELSDGITYSLGQVLMYDGQKKAFLTEKRKKDMSEIVARELEAGYKGQWESILSNIYDEKIMKICKALSKKAPAKIPDVAGYELEVEDEIVAEAEVCWLKNKVVILASVQLEYKEIFEENGWKVFGDNVKADEVIKYLN